MKFQRFFVATAFFIFTIFGCLNLATTSAKAQSFFSPVIPVLPSSSPVVLQNTPQPVVRNLPQNSIVYSYLSNVITTSVERGISQKTLVLLLLLPAVATLVAFSRHVIGLTGFSIYAPTGLAIVLISTGILPGTILFLLMLAIAAVSKSVISLLKLEYIPRTAMLLWSVSIGIFLTILISTIVPALAILRLDMLSVLLMVLLAEDFMAPLSGLKWKLIAERSLQILCLAILGAMFMSSVYVEQFTLLNPEVVIVLVAVANFLVGRYLGLRLTEYFRFRPIMDAEE